MGISIPKGIFGFKGQSVNEIKLNKDTQEINVICRRDRRMKVIDPVTGKKGTVNRYVNRKVRDIAFAGYPCILEIQQAQVFINKNERRIENFDFLDKGRCFTRCFCQLVSGLCRHMSIQAVSRHLKLRWETVKNIDRNYLKETLPKLDPTKLSGVEYIGVDEVAKAKGHDYMTVVYDMVRGQLIGVETGRTAEAFTNFLKLIPKETAAGIKTVAMDMEPAYQKAVKESLPSADIVFDRFHVVQNYGKVINNQRRAEFRKANEDEKKILKGTRYLLLKNADKLSELQGEKLQILLQNNDNLNILYVMKEQLQALWEETSFEDMARQLENWW